MKKLSEEALEEAIHYDEIWRSVHFTDPARRVMARARDFALREAERLEAQGE